jgi:hypothetical protein
MQNETVSLDAEEHNYIGTSFPVVCDIDRARTENQPRTIDQSVEQGIMTLEVSSYQQLSLQN